MQFLSKLKFNHLHRLKSQNPSLPNLISSIFRKPLSKPNLTLSSPYSSTPEPYIRFPSSEVLIPLSSVLKNLCATVFNKSLYFDHNRKPLPPRKLVNLQLLEQHVTSNPNDAEAIELLIHIYTENRNWVESIPFINRMIHLQPSDTRWPVTKGMGYYYSGEPDLAKFEMQEVLLKDPLCFKAYHWLVRLSVEDEWEGLRKRIEGVIGKCPKDVRDFRLLLGYVRYLEGRFDEALKIYQELADELPEDFRPYLYLGVINVVSLKSNEAKMHFEKYRSLVPKDEPDSVHFKTNVDLTHHLIQALEY